MTANAEHAEVAEAAETVEDDVVGFITCRKAGERPIEYLVAPATTPVPSRPMESLSINFTKIEC